MQMNFGWELLLSLKKLCNWPYVMGSLLRENNRSGNLSRIKNHSQVHEIIIKVLKTFYETKISSNQPHSKAPTNDCAI